MKLKNFWLSASLNASLAFLLFGIHSINAIDGDSVVSEPIKETVKLDSSVFTKEPGNAEKHQFSAEVSRLLNIITHSVYTDKKAVVRELISNCLDAIEKQHEKKLAVADKEGLDEISNYKVLVEVDTESKIISFTDNGIGMSHDELKTFLGTIAKSGTAEFAAGKASKASTADASNLIGQFGVGFYSVLLVAEKVAVISKSDSDSKQWIWETDATASFRISEDSNGPTLGRGTRVMLKIKDDSKEFLEHDKLEKIMKEYFGYDRHRIYLSKPKEIEVEAEESKEKDVASSTAVETEGKNATVEVEDEKEKEEKDEKKKIKKTIIEEVLISQNMKPIWQRSPSDVKPDEYEQLYKSISGDKFGKPIAYTHFSGETGKGESFRAVLFIPERPPFTPFNAKEDEKLLDLKLHVRGVFVTAKFDDFIPKHLSFVRGIIDSDDISLNISREILQNTNELRGIRKKIIKKIIEMMTEMANNDAEKFKKFYSAYSSHLKLAVGEHEEYRSLLSKLLRYQTTKTEPEKTKSLDEYIESMPEAQKSRKVIYYLAGFPDEVKKSPYLARFKEKGYEVVLMTEPVDEHVAQRLDKHDEYKLTNIAKEGIKLDDDEEKESKDYDEKFKKAKEWLLKTLSSSIDRISIVTGPASIPGSLKSAQYGWTGNMERLVAAQTSVNDDPMLAFFSKQKRMLELNPKHEVVAKLLEEANMESPKSELRTIVRTFVDAMTVWSGYSIRDPSNFANGVERLTRKSLGLTVEELANEPEPEPKNEKEGSSEDDYKDLDVRDIEKMAEAGEVSKEISKSFEKEAAESSKQQESSAADLEDSKEVAKEPHNSGDSTPIGKGPTSEDSQTKDKDEL